MSLRGRGDSISKFGRPKLLNSLALQDTVLSRASLHRIDVNPVLRLSARSIHPATFEFRIYTLQAQAKSLEVFPAKIADR